MDISHLTLPDDFHNITDFYVPEEYPKATILYPGPKKAEDDLVILDFIHVLLENAKKKQKLDFSLEFKHGKHRIILRGHSIESVEGKVFIFRRLPSFVPKVEDIGMSEHIMELLLSDRLNSGGLILIAGETGQGKSTTAASTIAYRLRTYGSFCLTIESPVELPLQGFYPNPDNSQKVGVCFQKDVDEEDIAEHIKSALRCYPAVNNSILFLGETRTPEMASEVLKIAANGHLVVSTMHGADLMTSLKRFLSLASSATNANEAEVKSMFASVFRLMIHQKLERLPTGKKRVKQTVLFSSSSASSIASRLRSGTLEVLATEIQTQNMMLNQNKSLLTDLK